MCYMFCLLEPRCFHGAIYIYIVSGYVLQFLDSIWVVVSQVG
jgi:hypothetical protein